MKFNVRELCTHGGTRQTDFLQTYNWDLDLSLTKIKSFQIPLLPELQPYTAFSNLPLHVRIIFQHPSRSCNLLHASGSCAAHTANTAALSEPKDHRLIVRSCLKRIYSIFYPYFSQPADSSLKQSTQFITLITSSGSFS